MNDAINDIIMFFYHDIFDSEFTSTNILHKLTVTFIIIFISVWLYKLIKVILKNLIKNIKIRTVLQITLRNIFVFITTLILLSTWVNMKNSVLLILLLVAGLVAFSIKNLSNNLVAWFMMMRKKYFKLYDRIEIDDITGDVIKITPFYFKMMERGNTLSSATATGRIILIPNHVLLNNKLYNHSRLLPINWTEVHYTITIDSNWQDALKVVEEVGNNYVEDFLSQYSEEELSDFRTKASLFDEKLKLKTYVFLKNEGIDIVAQFPVHYTASASTQSHLNKQIISQLSNLPNVEMNDKTTHLHVDNLNTLSSSKEY